MWFYIDENGNFERLATEADAIAGAKAALDECRELAAADDVWPDEVRGICWGVIKQRVTADEIHRHGVACATDDEQDDCLEGYSAEHDLLVDYVLADVEVAK